MLKFLSAIFAGVLLLSSAAHSSQINMRFKRQQQSNWCWAATTTSVINYMYKRGGYLGSDSNGEYVYQCSLASKYNAPGQTSQYCCKASNASSNTCNKPGSVAKPLQQFKIFKDQITGIIDDEVFLKITSEINSGRPVIGAIKWSGQNVGHAIIAYGIGFGGIAGGQAIYINDPTTGNQVGLTGKNGLNNYGSNQNGNWKATYVVKNAP